MGENPVGDSAAPAAANEPEDECEPLAASNDYSVKLQK